MSAITRWKYLTVCVRIGWTPSSTSEKLQAELDRQANNGWEFVTVTATPNGLQVVFKRPV